MTPLRIILADDHKMLRQGLKVLLDAEPGFQVVGEAADGLEAIELVQKQHPDILVTDLKMPGADGIQVAAEVNRICPRTAVILLSMYNDEAYISRAFQAGARGYVLKESSAEELVKAIYAIKDGKTYRPPPESLR